VSELEARPEEFVSELEPESEESVSTCVPDLEFLVVSELDPGS